ncbi:MAG: Crp/Fnr family transcriptional regulator [Burkholderiales bacterium]
MDQSEPDFRITSYLAQLPLFTDMAAVELERLAAGCSVRRYARGQTLFSVGEPCHEFHVMVSGQVKLFALSAAGNEKVIELLSFGHSFGEALAFSDRPYIVSAQALVDSMVLHVRQSAVLREIELDSRFALRMIAGMSRRLHGLVHDVQAYALHSGTQRVIGYLLRDQRLGDVPPGEPVTVTLPVSKVTIASRLSITPEYLSRILRELDERGLIKVDKRDIHIPDARRLAEYPPA